MGNEFLNTNNPGKGNQPSGERLIKTSVSLFGRKSDSFYKSARYGETPVRTTGGVPGGKSGMTTQKATGRQISFKDSPKTK